MIFDTISILSSTAILLSWLMTQNIETHMYKPDLKCGVCYEQFRSAKQLFEHIHQNSHYSEREPNGTWQQLSPHILEKIEEPSVEDLTNSHEHKQIQ